MIGNMAREIKFAYGAEIANQLTFKKGIVDRLDGPSVITASKYTRSRESRPEGHTLRKM